VLSEALAGEKNGGCLLVAANIVSAMNGRVCDAIRLLLHRVKVPPCARRNHRGEMVGTE